MTMWKRVAEELPTPGTWVHVWHQGRLVLAKYIGDGGVHDWLLLPPGSHPFAPYSSHSPRWWIPLVDPPPGDPKRDPIAFPGDGLGEHVVRWRGSVDDLATDLKALLSIEEREKLCVALGRSSSSTAGFGGSAQGTDGRSSSSTGGSGGGAGAEGSRASQFEVFAVGGGSRAPQFEGFEGGSAGGRVPSTFVEGGSGGGTTLLLPVSLLLWCPECNERHIDRGEFASKPHHTHACQFCGHVWRPAVAPTVGVQFLPGFKNEKPSVSLRAPTFEPHVSIGFWCPVTRGKCSRPCMGSECLLSKKEEGGL